MFAKIKAKISQIVNWTEQFLLGEEVAANTYCIPCTWVITGRVYINAPNAELAKAYVRTQKINPDLENCYCYNIKPDIKHPILCECGNCGGEYVISEYHSPKVCPHCGNGGGEN